MTRPVNNFVSIGDETDLCTSPTARAEEFFIAAELLRKDRTEFANSGERTFAASMRHPIRIETAFAIFGLALGIAPLTAVIIRIVIESQQYTSGNALFLALFGLTAAATGSAGYLTSRFAVRAEAFAARQRISWYLSILPFIGVVWGMVCGVIGGVFLFVIGAFFGGIIGAITAGLLFPLFAIAVRSVSVGGNIDLRYLAPILFGTAGAATTLVVGF